MPEHALVVLKKKKKKKKKGLLTINDLNDFDSVILVHFLWHF